MGENVNHTDGIEKEIEDYRESHRSSHHHRHRHHHRSKNTVQRIVRKLKKTSEANKRYIVAVICLTIIFAGLIFYVKQVENSRNISEEKAELGFEKDKEHEEALKAAIKEYLPGIVCWGDSLTYGGYPEELSKLIETNVIDPIKEKSSINGIAKIKVFNEGVQGETSGEITARSGAVPYILQRSVNIPAERVEVSIQLGIQGTKNSGNSVAFYKGETYKVNLGGISGIMKVGKRQTEDYSYFYHTFKRSSEGEVTMLPAGTEMYVEDIKDYSGNIPVIFMGQNEGWDNDPEVLISQVKSIVKHTQNIHNRFIVVGLHTGTPEERKDLEIAMEKAFGKQYINLRKYMCTSGIKDIGMTPTAEDLLDMEKGITPKSVMKDDLHFTDVGNRIVATAVYNRMEQLGYFEEIRVVADEFGKF